MIPHASAGRGRLPPLEVSRRGATAAKVAVGACPKDPGDPPLALVQPPGVIDVALGETLNQTVARTPVRLSGWASALAQRPVTVALSPADALRPRGGEKERAGALAGIPSAHAGRRA